MAELDRPILPNVADIARRAVKKHGVTSFADLGACYAVNAGYAFDLLSAFPIERAYAYDMIVTDLSRKRGEKYPQLSFVSGVMNELPFIQRQPDVDALLMNHILLHQVDLDWDEFLREWSRKARVLIIYNQMWAEGDKSVRFIDHGLDWYKERVFYGNAARIDEWFRTHDEMDPTGRKKRDISYFWQFGIVRGDLLRLVESLGFRLDYFENFGPWLPDKPWIQNEGFVFVKE